MNTKLIRLLGRYAEAYFLGTDEKLSKGLRDIENYIATNQKQLLQIVRSEIIDICRKEYIAYANTPSKDRINGSKMAIQIQDKQLAALNSLEGEIDG